MNPRQYMLPNYKSVQPKHVAGVEIMKYDINNESEAFELYFRLNGGNWISVYFDTKQEAIDMYIDYHLRVKSGEFDDE